MAVTLLQQLENFEHDTTIQIAAIEEKIRNLNTRLEGAKDLKGMTEDEKKENEVLIENIGQEIAAENKKLENANKYLDVVRGQIATLEAEAYPTPVLTDHDSDVAGQKTAINWGKVLGIIGISAFMIALLVIAIWVSSSVIRSNSQATEKMGAISGSFGTMQKDVGTLKTDVADIKLNGATKTEVTAVQTEVTTLTNTVATKTEVNNLTDQVKKLGEVVAAIPGKAEFEAMATAMAKEVLAKAPKPQVIRVKEERIIEKPATPVPTAPAPAVITPAPVTPTPEPPLGPEVENLNGSPTVIPTDDSALDARVFGYLKGQHPKISDENIRADVASKTREQKLEIDSKIGKYVGKKQNGFFARLKGKAN